MSMSGNGSLPDVVERHARAQAERERMRELEHRTRERFDDASEWVARAMPDCTSPDWGPCPLLVSAAIMLRDQLGQGNVRASTVRARVARLYPEHVREDCARSGGGRPGANATSESRDALPA